MTRRPYSRLLFAIAAVLALAACEEEKITLQSGDPSTLDVLVYVDVNGNGTFDAGDQALVGSTVAVTGPVDASAETGSDGVATFDGLVPGTYAISLDGTPPTGAVLATATTPVVVAPFQGAELEAEFRYSFEPGSISGRLFRDDDEDGEFDEGEFAAAGITVTAERLSDGAEFETTTDGDGSFEILGLRPGTYTVTFDLPEDAQLVAGESITVEVGSTESATVAAVFTGEITVDISKARGAAPGTVATVEGTVSWHPDFNNRFYYIQDESGGIAVFDFNRPDLVIGDVVRLTGPVTSFDGELQISPVNNLEVLSSDMQPTPLAVTGEEIDEDVAAELVTIDGTLETVEVRSFDNQYLVFRDPSGTEFSVYVDSRIGVASTFWTEGETYSVTGVVGMDDDELRLYQIEPRMPSDIAQIEDVPSIQFARGSGGETLTVEGVVTRQTPWDSRIYFFQDASGGISTFHSGAPTLTPGDRIELMGTVSAFRGEVQFSPVSSVTVLGSEAVPAALEVTGAEINMGLFQGMLVEVTGTVEEVEVVNSFGTHVVTLEDAEGTLFSVFVDNRSGLSADDWTEGEEVTVVGVLGADSRNDRTPHLEVLLDTDVTFSP